MPDHPCQKQVSRRFRNEYARFALVILLLLPLLSACGKKPNEVDPPPGVPEDSFPKTYPNPATDPHPE